MSKDNIRHLPVTPLAETEAMMRLTKHCQVLKRENLLLQAEADRRYITGYRDGVRDAADKIEMGCSRGMADLKDQLLYVLTDLLDPSVQAGAGPVNARGDPF